MEKTVYFCPVEGSVSKEDPHTHTYHLKVLEDSKIKIECKNEGYLVKGTKRWSVELTKKQVRKNADIVDFFGDLEKCLKDFPDAFIETLVVLNAKIKDQNENNIERITPQRARKIINTRKPTGYFYTVEDGKYIAIDNQNRDAWTEEFKKYDKCIDFLKGKDSVKLS